MVPADPLAGIDSSTLSTGQRREIREIYAEIPSNIAEIFRRAEAETPMAGELCIYELLVDRGVDPELAAKASVTYPDPTHFNPSNKPTCDRVRQLFAQKIMDGKSPLEALSNVGSESHPSGSHYYDYGPRDAKLRRLAQQ